MHALHGSRCLLYTRGQKTDGRNSVDQQIERLEDFACRHQLQVVGWAGPDRISATSDHNYVLERLAKRKQEVDDFDLLLMTDLSRLNRGSMQAVHMLVKLAEIGISIVTLDNGVIDKSLMKMIVPGSNIPARPKPQNKKENPDENENKSPDQCFSTSPDDTGGEPVPPRTRFAR